VIDGVLGIDVSKNTLDASMSSRNKVRARSFANSPDGWRHLLDWLITQRVRRVHACLESTGRYSLGIAGALNEAGHVVSIVNPAQIRDFARTKLGRNKTDGVDASHIREYCELFKPKPWALPSEAHRRLGELQTIRAGIIAGLTEWKNRKNSGMIDGVAQSLADVTISHFTSSVLSTRPSHRQSTMIPSCDGNAIFCLASAALVRPWLASCWPNYLVRMCCTRVPRWSPMWA
jgi:hypothetical protein